MVAEREVMQIKKRGFTEFFFIYVTDKGDSAGFRTTFFFFFFFFFNKYKSQSDACQLESA